MNADKPKIALGCYTDEAHPNGLKVLELDESSGVMSVLAEYPVRNAIYQAFSPGADFLYTCTDAGAVSFAVNGAKLTRLDEVDLGGECVCHVSAMPDGKRVVFADYLGGFAGSVEVEDGRFGKVTRHRHSGSGPNLPRQDRAHCHQAIPAPDGKGYFVVDLGLDSIFAYPGGSQFVATGKGTDATDRVPSGAGPRHLLFHPNERLAFLAYELGNLVASLSWSRADGFKLLDACPTLDGSRNSAIPHSQDLAAAIRFTPDMKRVVVSNRGENSLAVFDFDESTGRLEFKARTMLAGSWPRDFIFATDSLALVACERSGEVQALGYEKDTGMFKTIATLSGLFRPVSLCKRILP